MIHHINKMKNKNHVIISIDTEKAKTNSICIHDKSSPESRHKGKLPPQEEKGVTADGVV